MGVQSLRGLDIGQVAVVGPNDERLHALQPMPPLLQCKLDSQEFAVADIIVSLRRREKKAQGWSL